MVPKEESNLKSVEVKKKDETEYRVCEEAGRDSGNVEASVVAEFVTGLIESVLRDVDLQSQKDPPELESVKTSSAHQIVTRIPEVILEEGKISPPTRKSLTPQMPKKEKAGVTKEEPIKEKHLDDKEHEHVCKFSILQEPGKDSGSVDASAGAGFITGFIESPLCRADDLRSQIEPQDLKSGTKSSAPHIVAGRPQVVVSTEEKISPPQRKSKSKPPFEEATVFKQMSSYSRDQTEEPRNPQPPKRKSKSSTASLGIPQMGTQKTKESERLSSSVGFAETTVEEDEVVTATSESVTMLPETQKGRKPQNPTEPNIAICEGFGPGSRVKSTAQQSVKTAPDATVLGERNPSPPKRKSKIMKASAEPKKTISSEVPNILKLKEAKEDETISVAVEESTSEMLENVMESDVTKLSVLTEDQTSRSQTVTEMSLAEQTMVSIPTVMELEMLETTRERCETAKDHKVEDANTDLENTSMVLDLIPGSADVNTLELNVQNQVRDEKLPATSRTERQNMVQGPSSTVLEAPQPNATELMEIVLCEKAMENTWQTEALVGALKLNPEGLRKTEEHEASESIDDFQDTPMTIHVGPDVCLLQVEIRASQEEQKHTQETGKKDGDKPITVKSQVEKQEMSTERHKIGAQSDVGKPFSVAFNPDQPSGTKKNEVQPNPDNKPPQLIQTTLEKPKEDIHQVQQSSSDWHIGAASFLEPEEIQMTLMHRKEPQQESSVQIEIKTLKTCDIEPNESSMRVPHEVPECLTEILSHPHLDMTSQAQTEQKKSNGTKEESESGKVPQDVPHTGPTTTTFKKNEASVEQSELDASKRSRLTDIFSDTRAIADTELLKEESCEDCLAVLMSSPAGDLDGLLCRLLSNLLSCKNQPAELPLAAMSQQVKEAEKCRAVAQDRGALLCQQKEAEFDKSEALKYMEDKWSAAAQEANLVVQNKVDQLQVVQEFCHQTHKAQTTLERLKAQLDVLRLSPAESSQEEGNHLNFMKRTLEEKRTLLGELLGIHIKLQPRLSRAHQGAAKSLLQTQHHEWRELERAVEKAAHHRDVQSHICSKLLLELSHLRGHLKSVSEEVEAEHPEESLWDCKKAKQLIWAHAEVKAAHVKYLHLKETSEALPLSLWPKETVEIKKALRNVKDQFSLTEEWMSSHIPQTSNPIIKKVLTLGRDGVSWTKALGSEIECRCSRVCLLPEEVHQQLRALKKLHSEVTVKQRQLKSQVKAATELLPQLDQTEEMPVMHSLLEYLEECSKSVGEKLSVALTDIESGLQVREKLSEQIADLDSWVKTRLQRKTLKRIKMQFTSPAEVDGSGIEIQETLVEAQKQSAACEALFMKTKDIASELSVTESCKLYSKLVNLQEDINNIITHERVNKHELDEDVRAMESHKRDLTTVEKSLRQMREDLNKLRFPVTTESLQVFESFKHMLLEHISKIDLLQFWIHEEKTRELYSITGDINNKLTALQMKARDHEDYLSTRQSVEDLSQAVEKQLSQTKEDTQVEEKYKIYQELLFRFPLIKRRCQEVESKLHMISTDLNSSQLFSERQRLQQNEDHVKNLELKTLSDLSVVEWSLVKELDLDSERKAMRAFLRDAHQELQNLPLMMPNETCIDKEYKRILFLKTMVESRMRALEVLERHKGKTEGIRSSDLDDLKNFFRRECDSQMDNISDARTSLRNYTHTIKQALQFLRDFEVSLLPIPAVTGVCCEKLEETQGILATLEDHFQPYVDQLSQVALHPFLSPVELERLQQTILSQLLVRMSTLKAKGYLQLENLSSCAENYRKYTKLHEEMSLSIRKAEANLERSVSQTVNSLADCSEHLEKLKVLQEDLDSVQKHLEEMVEWCPEQRCRGHRENSMAVAWRCVTNLRLCSQHLTARLKQKIVDWSDITRSVEKASASLQQVEEELPDPAPLMASTKELLDLHHCWEQYQDRLDCEHRALSALELRVARLLGVPANMEQAPPTPLCQQLQAMQTVYDTIKQRSQEGLEWIKLELEEREKVQEELQVVWVWLTAADSLLSEMDPSSRTAELKEIHSQLCIQKALVHRIKERMTSKYFESDMVPVEIDGRLQEVQKTLEQVEAKVEDAIEKSGPVHRIGAKILETEAGLRSVQEMLEDRSWSVEEAKLAQKMVWDELDKWHTCVAALESDVQSLESPQEVLSLTESLVEVQQFHVQLAKRAEQKTTLLSKTQTWLEEHQEMINSSKSWMSDSQSWLATPRTYTRAKCLSDHVGALQTALNDSEQIRTALQGFSSVLDQMSQVVEVSTLREQLLEADLQVAAVQDSFAAPLSRLERAAAEVDMMETEVRKMENSIAEMKTIFYSPETLPSPKEKHLKMVEQRILSLRSSIADIQKSKLNLHLPEKAEDTLTVFSVIDQLQTLLVELEKKVPTLFIQQLPAQTQHTQRVRGKAQAGLENPSSEESEESDPEPGRIRIAHTEDDLQQCSGASPMTAESATPEQKYSGRDDSTPAKNKMRQEVGRDRVAERTRASNTQSLQESGGPDESSSEAISSTPDSVRCQNVADRMVNTSTVSKAEAGSQQRCLLC
ncbi:nesprin-2-like isoform X2 [Syngnathoides biaculeatus]|uniref:nesprin-2-like isoform X2 n=1 Tax=Syngnathoides biaculeatus TaxID=300417 RepID=UPI002ADD8390|nr:nesprin-2-like isoform X2 [Syngnathoides biaculeatus]